MPPCCATSTRPRASTRASSPPTPRAPCGSSARRIRSRPRAASWRCSTTTTRSTASASSRAPRARETAYVPLEAPDLRVDDAVLERYLDDAAPAGHNLFAYPAQSNFSGVKHPLEWIAHGPGAGLGRDRRLRRVRADEPARPVASGSRTSSRSPSTRCSATRPGSARCSPGATALERLQRPWFSGGTVIAANVQGDMVVPLSGPCAVRGRHRQLPRHPGDRDRPAPHRADRHRHDRAAGAGPRLVAARRAAAAAALGRQPGDARLRADDVGAPRGHDLVQLPASGRPRDRRALRRRRRGRARHLGPDRAASATRAPARPRSRSRATR